MEGLLSTGPTPSSFGITTQYSPPRNHVTSLVSYIQYERCKDHIPFKVQNVEILGSPFDSNISSHIGLLNKPFDLM